MQACTRAGSRRAQARAQMGSACPRARLRTRLPLAGERARACACTGPACERAQGDPRASHARVQTCQRGGNRARGRRRRRARGICTRVRGAAADTLPTPTPAARGALVRHEEASCDTGSPRATPSPVSGPFAPKILCCCHGDRQALPGPGGWGRGESGHTCAHSSHPHALVRATASCEPLARHAPSCDARALVRRTRSPPTPHRHPWSPPPRSP